jgi:hypothetical protein
LVLILGGCGGGNGGEQSNNSVTLAWDPPDSNVDGTELKDLAGYYIYYRRASDSDCTLIGYLDQNPNERPYPPKIYKINNLPPGEYFFRVKAYDTSGNVSDFSNEYPLPGSPPYRIPG